jgi:hypothetical protein
MKPPQKSPSLTDWSFAVGDFMIKFGCLEYLVNVYLKENLDSTEFANVSKRSLKDRLAKLMSLHYGRSSAAKAHFQYLLSRIKSIRDLRNRLPTVMFLSG